MKCNNDEIRMKVGWLRGMLGGFLKPPPDEVRCSHTFITICNPVS
jgi:hypothetical protein